MTREGSMTFKSRLLLGSALAALCLAAGSDDAKAQDRNRMFGYHGFGPRVGFSIDPEQFVIGAHIDFGEAFPQVRFQPDIEIGFGGDLEGLGDDQVDLNTVISFDADFHYRFLESWDVWNPYLGGGVGLTYWSFDVPEAFEDELDSTDTDIQLHISGGIERYISAGKFFVETKIGFDEPDLKFLAGWTFVQ
jgi:hypothetical protein